MRSARLLARFSLTDTCHLDEARAALARAYAPPTLELVGRNRPFRAIVNGYRLRHSAMNFGWYSAELRMDFPDCEFAAQVFAVAGTCEARTKGVSGTIDSTSGIVISPGEALTVTNCSDCARLILRLEPLALANKLTAITGQSCHLPLKLNPRHDSTLPRAKALREHFLFLVDTVGESAVPLPQPAIDEFEETLLVMFLHANRHNYSHLLEGAPAESASWQVRRAEEFIAAHAGRAISLEELAEIAGVSVRSLFRSFRKMRGYTPLEFLAQMRSGWGKPSH